MSSISVVKKKRSMYIDLKLQKNEMINMREFEVLSKRQVDYFLPTTFGKRNKSVVRYDITGLTSLRNYLHIVINKQNFLQIVLSIIETLKNTQQMMLYNKNILLTSDYVFINPMTKKIMYVYIPITNYNTEIDVKAFFYSLVFGTIFNQTEDCSYVKEYIDFFKSNINFSLFELEKFVMKLSGGKNGNDAPMAHSSKLLTRDRVSGQEIRTEQQNNTQGNKFVKAQVHRPLASSVGQTSSTFIIDTYEPEEEYGGTTVLGMQEEGTTILSEQAYEPVAYPTLIRSKTGENIKVNKNVFSLGKSQNADYCITENSAISRLHAEIITKDGKYYVKDTGSTNGTFVDGNRINAKEEIEILPGQTVRLADEEFSISV